MKIIKIIITAALIGYGYVLYWTPKDSYNEIINIDKVGEIFTIWNDSQLDKIFKLTSCEYGYSKCHYESTRGKLHGFESLYTLSNDDSRAVLVKDEDGILKRQSCNNILLRFSRFEDDSSQSCEAYLFRMNNRLAVFVVGEESELLEYYRGWSVVLGIVGLLVFTSIWNGKNH